MYAAIQWYKLRYVWKANFYRCFRMLSLQLKYLKWPIAGHCGIRTWLREDPVEFGTPQICEFNDVQCRMRRWSNCTDLGGLRKNTPVTPLAVRLTIAYDKSILIGKKKWNDVVVLRSTLHLNKSTCHYKRLGSTG